MKRIVLGILAASIFVPGIAFAASFAKQTLFLSKSSVTEGDTVLIHAVVANDVTAKFAGQMEINDGEKLIGTVPVSLAAGEATAVSVSWKPTAGEHTIRAELHDSKGAVVEQESQTFTIAAKTTLPTTAFASSADTATTAVESSQDIQNAINNVSPAVANVAEPVFSTIDSARASAASVLDQGTVWSKKQLGNSAIKNQGTILGTEAPKSATTKITTTAWTVVATVLLYLFSILRYIVGNAGVFYPIFAVFFFFLLWKLYRRFRRR